MAGQQIQTRRMKSLRTVHSKQERKEKRHRQIAKQVRWAQKEAAQEHDAVMPMADSYKSALLKDSSAVRRQMIKNVKKRAKHAASRASQVQQTVLEPARRVEEAALTEATNKHWFSTTAAAASDAMASVLHDEKTRAKEMVGYISSAEDNIDHAETLLMQSKHSSHDKPFTSEQEMGAEHLVFGTPQTKAARADEFMHELSQP